jgi:hypothetical protein
MNLGFIVFILGLFGVPIVLLAFGHRLRRRGNRERAAFWGAVLGHCVAGTLALVYGMIPPEQWTDQEIARGFAGLWSLLVFPLAGAVIGALASQSGGSATQR